MPITGTRRKKLTATGRKPLQSYTNNRRMKHKKKNMHTATSKMLASKRSSAKLSINREPSICSLKAIVVVKDLETWQVWLDDTAMCSGLSSAEVIKTARITDEMDDSSMLLNRIIPVFSLASPLLSTSPWLNINQLECGPMPNVMAALWNIGGAICSMLQSLADAPTRVSRAVTLPRRKTRWNYLGCPKLTKRSQPVVGLSCEDIARQSCAMVPRQRFYASCISSEPRAVHFRPAF